ncbi:hypothetical protein [Kordia sp.]|uniref:hypothetical protein n=1 Tax=Kordia sp. TaxID=1965332 RepID=UPI003B595747
MAHENLRFNLDTSSDKYQPIFGNQELGTFFMIYMQIISYKQVEYSPGIITHSYEVKFKIQNFRGAITMGFNGVPTINSNTGHDIQIKLPVSPFSSKAEIPYIINSTKKLEKGFTIDSIAVINSIPSNIANSYIDPRKFQRNGDTLDAVITLDNDERNTFLENLERLDLNDTPKVEAAINKVISYMSENLGGGGNGICCPRISVVI